MNDEETVALTVGGHTFGKMHGAVKSDIHGPEPEGAGLMAQGFGWANTHEIGFGEYTLTSGLEGAWTPTPTKWDNTYLETIFAHEWELVESPAGAKQWQPREVKEGFWVPDAHVEGKVRPAHDVDRRHGDGHRPGVPGDLRSGTTRTPTSSPTRSPGRGSSSCTATWARPSATSAHRSPTRSSSGRTMCRPTRAR